MLCKVRNGTGRGHGQLFELFEGINGK